MTNPRHRPEISAGALKIPTASKHPRFEAFGWWTCLLTVAALLWAEGPLAAQESVIHADGYLSPAEEIAEIVAAPRHELVSLDDLSPDGRFFLHEQGVGLLSLEEMARPHLNLAGLYVDHRAHRNRNLTIRGTERMELIEWESGERIAVGIPEGARAQGVTWSPDGRHLAFLAAYETETHLYVAEAATGEAQRLSPRPVLATRVTAPSWSGDGEWVYTVLLPEARGSEPQPPVTPTTPLVRVTAEEENRLRTFPTLLRTPHDEEMVEYHTTGQLARISIVGGVVESLGAPAMFEEVDPGPDGAHVRVRTTQRPFSFLVPVSSFAHSEEIWDESGESLVEVTSREIQMGVPDQNDEEERRAIQWRPDGAGLSFLKRDSAEDNDENDGTRMDRVMQWAPPFGEDDLTVVYESENQIRSLRYSDDARILFLTEEEDDEEHLYAVFLDDPEERHTLFRRDTKDPLDDPGSLVTRPGTLGGEVVRLSPDQGAAYLSGMERHEAPLEEAPRPFLDRIDLRSGETERLFESSSDAFEQVTAILDPEVSRVVVTRETPSDVPNAFVRELADGSERQLTDNLDPTPALTAAQRVHHRVRRPDGIGFNLQVTLPPDWDGERLPGMIWFYPREYADQEALDYAGRDLNINRYPSVGPRSAEIFALAGYAVLQPDHPIVGPMDRVNDNYVPDLQANHLAVIDLADREGYIDRSRMSLGGHSYGGFGTINAMVRTPYFRAGIAGAPNSNRLLTPLGFQFERRLLWESRESYLEMSPFLWAERLQGALLVYHGDDDQNVGTFPDNSWRLFHALNGLGKTSALYMYPYEGHGPAARETLMDMWARWIVWLDHYVRDAEEGEPVRPVSENNQEGSS